jgi:hypothetical protein
VQRNEIRGCGAELGEGIEAGKRDDIPHDHRVPDHIVGEAAQRQLRAKAEFGCKVGPLHPQHAGGGGRQI